MWSLTQLVNSLFSPQSEVEKAAAVEERYFNTQEQQAMSDSEAAAASQAVRSTSANSGLSSSNNFERAVEKLRGYFTLAKEEIDKGVRSEEWGLNADALAHYKNANRILIEGMGADVNVDPGNPLYGSVKTYKEKMRKWQDKVLERLRVLDNRPGSSGGGSYAQKLVSIPRKAPASVRPASSIPVQPALTRPVSRSRPQPNPANGALQPVNLKGVDPKLVEAIENDVVDRTPAVKWTDIAGLAKAKLALMEMVILPTIRKDLFQGLRKPARGLLLFGPPGNGKTMLAKAVASESAATFFSISASSLTSKWVGEAEKLVKALFGVAAARQPSVIFIDEIDSIMSTRSVSEHEASRRLKTEFLVQFDGVISNENDHVIVMAATNRPEELDDALRRRLVKRIYIPLPDADGRRTLLQHLLKGHTAFSLEGPELEKLVKDTDGYSGSDLHALCQEAAMMPLRELGPRVSTIRPDQVRALTHKDFKEALKAIRPSVSKEQLIQYEQFNAEYGSLS